MKRQNESKIYLLMKKVKLWELVNAKRPPTIETHVAIMVAFVGILSTVALYDPPPCQFLGKGVGVAVVC